MNSRSTKRSAGHESRGVTLVELMVVVAIIAILGAIAMPIYQNYVTESRRKVAQSQMVQLSASMERFFSDTNSYQNFPLGTNPGDLFPNYLPIEAVFAARHYNLALLDENANGGSNPTAFGYTIVATPRADGPQAGDGFITLNSMGVKGHDADDSGALSAAEQKWED